MGKIMEMPTPVYCPGFHNFTKKEYNTCYHKYHGNWYEYGRDTELRRQYEIAF
jgi:hypothetical protein